jgi:hypothetical protein
VEHGAVQHLVRVVGRRRCAGLLRRFLGVLVPYGALWVRNVTGSFAVAFLLIPVLLVIQLIGLLVARPDYARRPLDTIAT